MGTVTTVTISGNTYYTYALTAGAAVTDATTWHAGRLGSGSTAWGTATADNRAKSLVSASEWIDRAVGNQFSGSETSTSQPLEWPRDEATNNGVSVPDGTTPDDIAYAAFWLAGQLLVDANLASSTGTGSNVKEAKAGSALVRFFSSTIGTTQDTRLPITAMDFLRPFFGGSGTVYGAGVASGVTSASAFNAENFTRSEGFA
jgi:hypothetical protein